VALVIGDKSAKRTPDRTLTLAVVGVGYWGPNLIRNLNELPVVKRIVACDLRPNRLHAISRRFPSVIATTRYEEEIVADPTIDGVVISTPISTHYRLAEAAIQAGKHVMVEKPLAASSVEALSLIASAEQAGVVLMPGHTFLYSPPVIMIRSLIESGDIGDVYFISTSRVNLGLPQPDVSVTWDLGPHDFSILRHLLDESPVRVSALARGCIIPGVHDVAFVNLEYESGTVGHVELSWLAPSKLRRTTIVGSRKMIVYDDTSSEPVRVFDSGAVLRDPTTFGEFTLTYRTGDILSPHVEIAEPIYLELEDFCTAIVNGTTPKSSAKLGLEVVRTIEAVDESLARGGVRVEISATGSAARPSTTRPRSAPGPV
jgi:predicted dehydrogenase